MGSIAAGGHYGNLISSLRRDGMKIPGVGCSIGFERIFTLLESKRNKLLKVKTTSTQVLINYLDDSVTDFCFELCQELWQLGIAAKLNQGIKKVDLKSKIGYCIDNEIDFMLTIGCSEVKIIIAYNKSSQFNISYT